MPAKPLQVADPAAALMATVRQALAGGARHVAEHSLSSGLKQFPGHAGLLGLAAVHAAMTGATEASAAYADQALAVDPGEPVAAALRARQHLAACAAVAAEQVASTALAHRPDAVDVRLQLASALLFQGRAEAAAAEARAAAEAAPGRPDLVGHALLASLYQDTLAPLERLRLHQRLAAGLAPARTGEPLAPPSDGPLRVGFVSADLRNHPVGRLLRPVLEHLDTARFRACIYSDVAQPDEVTAALRALPHAWRDTCDDSDEALLARMRRDRLDVLVDLAGHSNGGRPRLLRGRAAPVQWSWLGYPFASGLPEVDALLGDALTLPDGAEHDHGTGLLRLPLGLFCLQQPEGLPPVAPLPMLARGFPTLGSFNHLAKLSDATVALWSRLLQTRPDARLVLCAVPLMEEAARTRTLARFERHGIDPGRIELRPPRPPGAAFLGQYADIDLAVDPLPFSGGATTLDALFQGVPVLTLPGDSFASRMSASILASAGLADFIAGDPGDWLARATDWLGRPDALASLRGDLRRRLARTPAADGERYTRAFERLLTDAARRPTRSASLERP